MFSAPPPLPDGQPLSKPGGLRPWIALLICLVPFLISLALPGVTLDDGTVWFGAHLLGIGWLGVFLGQFGWIANGFWLFAMLFLPLRLRVTTLVFTILAVLASLSSFTLIGAKIPMDEAGVKEATALSFGPALYFWLAALIAPGITTFWVKRRSRIHSPNS